MSEWKPNVDQVLFTRHGYVVDQLREAILRGYFKPGEKLDQNEIAGLFNVSRSPVRAALATLTAEGLIESYPHRGSVVAELTPEELEEIYLVRSVLEGMAARLGADNLSEEQIDRLGRLLSELEVTTDVDRRVSLNAEFHNTIYQAANRPRLYSIIQTLSNTAVPYTRLYFTTAEHWHVAHVGHQRIYQACVNRDGEAAQIATSDHIDDVCAGMLENMALRTTAD